MSWEMIEEMRTKASEAGDPIASMIAGLDLNSNAMTLSLQNPYDQDGKPKKISIDIGLSAHQNARKMHSEKKAATAKQQKTVLSSNKALKSAQQKTKQTLETVRAKADVVKSRQVMWFEKFFWFVTSEDFLVIGGRDAQQNEMLVKRYLRAGDIYVHADVRGASSVIIRSKPGKGEVPPKTLNEAGVMAICYSSAWEAKIVASAWWVYHHQVSRTAPTGEYLPSGSFMIRGKKNYLPACQLQMGFGLLFKLDENSLERHKGDRKAEEEEKLSEVKTEEKQDDEELDLQSEHESDEASGASEEFPDVQININDIMDTGERHDEDEYSIIQLGPSGGRILSENERARQEYIEEKKKTVQQDEERKVRPITKREKHKAEKIKKKYRDQDEEERELRLKLLASKPAEPPATKETAKLSKIKKETGQREGSGGAMEEVREEAGARQRLKKPAEELKQEEEQEEESDLLTMSEEETKMLESLTWRPLPEDTLLYAVVVVAPYNVMQKFKYKVKLTPGTGKRGKAAKSAIALFQRDKSASQQELNLLRVLATDDQAARNIPGKVRVSAKQLNKK